MMKIKQLKLNNIIEKLLIAFLIIQPVFDLKIFYNSISTLIRVIIIFAFFVYYFIKSKNNKKFFLFIYPLLIGIYFVFHHMNALKFKSLVPGNFNYSIVSEALYFVKMISPFLLIYSLYKSKLTNENLLSTIKYLALIISGSIVITNLLGVSYGSYSDAQIKANFFTWFNKKSNYTYLDLASKGLFEFANQIGAVLIMFLPFMIKTSLKEPKWPNWCILSLNILALILLCTKVSVLGVLVVFVYVLFAYGFIAFLNKKYYTISKQYTPILAIFLIYCILLPFNPMIDRMQKRAALSESVKTSAENKTTLINAKPNSNADTANDSNLQKVETSVEESDVDLKIKYITANYKKKQIHPQFIIVSYPYQYDPDFWYAFLDNNIFSTTDYRYVELSIIQRILNINNNPLDKWLGITNSRLLNIFNIERDFVVQYYALGIIGLILVFIPYFILLGIFVYIVLKQKFKNINILNLISFITIIFLFGISYMTGNLFNSLSFTIYFVICFTFLFDKEKKN